MAIEHSDVTSVHRMGHVTNTDPGAVGAYHAWVDTSVTPRILYIRNATNTDWERVGSIPDLESVGSGAEVFKTMNGETGQFRSIEEGDGITVTQNTNDIEIALDQTAIVNHDAMNGFVIAMRCYIASSAVTSTPELTIYQDPYNDFTFSKVSTGYYKVSVSDGAFPFGGVASIATIVDTSSGGSRPTVYSAYAFRDAVDSVGIKIYANNTGNLADPTDCVIDLFIGIKNI